MPRARRPAFVEGGAVDGKAGCGQRSRWRFEVPLHYVQRSSGREGLVWAIQPPLIVIGRTTVPDPYADIETMRSFDVKGEPALEERRGGPALDPHSYSD